MFLAGLKLIEKNPNIRVTLSEIIPRDYKKHSERRYKTKECNLILQSFCENTKYNLFFMPQNSSNWHNVDGTYNKTNLSTDNLHLTDQSINCVSSSITTFIKDNNINHSFVPRKEMVP